MIVIAFVDSSPLKFILGCEWYMSVIIRAHSLTHTYTHSHTLTCAGSSTSVLPDFVMFAFTYLLHALLLILWSDFLHDLSLSIAGKSTRLFPCICSDISTRIPQVNIIYDQILPLVSSHFKAYDYLKKCFQLEAFAPIQKLLCFAMSK